MVTVWAFSPLRRPEPRLSRLTRCCVQSHPHHPVPGGQSTQPLMLLPQPSGSNRSFPCYLPCRGEKPRQGQKILNFAEHFSAHRVVSQEPGSVLRPTSWPMSYPSLRQGSPLRDLKIQKFRARFSQIRAQSRPSKSATHKGFARPSHWCILEFCNVAHSAGSNGFCWAAGALHPPPRDLDGSRRIWHVPIPRLSQLHAAGNQDLHIVLLSPHEQGAHHPHRRLPLPGQGRPEDGRHAALH